jgi:hypothetical protein
MYLHRKKPLRESPLRLQAQVAPPARHPLSVDGVYRRKKNNEDRQQGRGPGMPSEDPQLPQTAERPSVTSAKSSHRGTVDIPFHVATEIEAVVNQQAKTCG